MKFGKKWCLAAGVLVGAAATPAAIAQNQPDQQNSSQKSGGKQSQGQSQPGSNAKANQNAGQEQSNGKQGSSSNANDPSNGKRPNTAIGALIGPDGKTIQNGQGNLSYLLNDPRLGNQNKSGGAGPIIVGNQQGLHWVDDLVSGGGQRWTVQSAGLHPELNLAAADDSVREHLNLPKDQGVVVNWVAPNSGAAQAGIQENDILLMVGENPVGKPEDFYDRLKLAGEKPVSLTLLRSGSRLTLQIQPVIRVSLRPVVSTAQTREYWIGLSVTAIEPVLRAQLRLAQDLKVIVNQVIRNSPAEHAGIALHDIIVAIDGKPVSDPNEVAKSVQAKGAKPLVLEIIGKGGKSRTVAVTPERKKAAETSQNHAPALDAARGNIVSYDIVRPGAVLDYNTSVSPNQTAGDLLSWTVPIIPDFNSRPQDAGPALSQRLDALDAELKKLLKLVEELQKTSSTMIERQKSAADSATKE